ncbi:hypothetical protein PSN45_003524 [Yamadazyma tenuis]|uniref:Six-hairpin glycosidase n=1 Tax=Candida tenuis (strain ATCC 10573 / BCRC 21748 / CBS 615 / JCM 9827 / NBRC 10315 / NRRL Y-1498 / VKM Y-70) TaxID=590646 RepID=G3AXT9_CANTC|nr:uncharacterized protein CANTEDRAFT_101282 [Yamadazyma tenuis ATCC 10573]EGV65695.1 hypothetical protein CANTEDRAFT_101282 [Yamadazyma tenuis ATCC 10573]WEJ95990.1 hypothetical protein PSN45_003524 [Yamadazyma tenuis]
MKCVALIWFLPWLARVSCSTNYASLFTDVVDFSWSRFWVTSKSSWSENDKCLNNFEYPSVWDQAVAGKMIADSVNAANIDLVIANLKDYLNSDNWFSSSTAKDNDVYMDDNAQVLWVLLDSYKYAGNVDDLELAKKLMSNLMNQEASGGGVYWKLNAPYVASISTAESALAATRLYQVTQDQSLLEFASKQVNWLLDNLQDSSDGLIYDGINSKTGAVNKGKLSYSVGVMVSTLAYLNSFTGESDYYDKATKLVNSALNKKGAFYNSDGTWNNPMYYSHLLFTGISDLITIATATSKSQDTYYQSLISEVNTQAQNIIKTYQVSTNNFVDNISSFKADSSNYCDGKPIGNLLQSASAAQIFYAMSKIGS